MAIIRQIPPCEECGKPVHHVYDHSACFTRAAQRAFAEAGREYARKAEKVFFEFVRGSTKPLRKHPDPRKDFLVARRP